MSFGEFERFYQEIFLDQAEIRRKVVAASANAITAYQSARTIAVNSGLG
jgi:hypothetical protein